MEIFRDNFNKKKTALFNSQDSSKYNTQGWIINASDLAIRKKSWF